MQQFSKILLLLLAVLIFTMCISDNKKKQNEVQSGSDDYELIPDSISEMVYSVPDPDEIFNEIFIDEYELNPNLIHSLSSVDQLFDSKTIALNMGVYFADMAYLVLMFRLGTSDFFLGGNYIYSDMESKRNEGKWPILDPLFEQEFNMAGLAAIIQYDTRDTIFTPSKGLFAKATVRRFDEHLGGQENFWRYGAKAFNFTPLHKTLILGLRVEGEAVHASEDDYIPFFANPSINMRGIPAMRYQGENMLLAEAQLRWEFINRWNLVLFGGAGKVFGSETIFSPVLGPVQQNTSFKDAETHPAGGVGFRYELARKFGLWGGLDFATSEEKDFAFYITVGSAWGGF